MVDGVVLTLHWNRRAEGCCVIFQVLLERTLTCRKRNSVLWALGTGNGWNHGRKIKLKILRVGRLNSGIVPEPLSLGVGLDQGHLLLGATGSLQVIKSHLINRENSHG